MKLVEFYDKKVEDKLPFDVVEDVHFHMIDDDSFYRKHYLPCMDKVNVLDDGATAEDYVMPMIDKCLNHYCLKYDINKLPKELLSKEERSDLFQRVMDYEKNPPEDLDATKKLI